MLWAELPPVPVPAPFLSLSLAPSPSPALAPPLPAAFAAVSVMSSTRNWTVRPHLAVTVNC